jgi:phytoene dehydrogenase-like protein
VLFGVDTPLYLSTHSPPADLAPPGHSLVHVMRYRAREDHLAPDDQRAELFAHAERAGVTVHDVVLDRYLHRMTAITALPTAAAGGLAGRPRHDLADVPGVFVAGDWVGPVGMLSDASLASAVAAARAARRVVTAVAG